MVLRYIFCLMTFYTSFAFEVINYNSSASKTFPIACKDKTQLKFNDQGTLERLYTTISPEKHEELQQTYVALRSLPCIKTPSAIQSANRVSFLKECFIHNDFLKVTSKEAIETTGSLLLQTADIVSFQAPVLRLTTCYLAAHRILLHDPKGAYTLEIAPQSGPIVMTSILNFTKRFPTGIVNLIGNAQVTFYCHKKKGKSISCSSVSSEE